VRWHGFATPEVDEANRVEIRIQVVHVHVVVPCHVHLHSVVAKENNIVRRVEIPAAVVVVNCFLCTCAGPESLMMQEWARPVVYENVGEQARARVGALQLAEQLCL